MGGAWHWVNWPSMLTRTVTPEMILSALQALVGDSSPGEGLAPGQSAFIADQNRPLPYLLYDVVKDTVAFSQKLRTPRP